MRQGGVCVCVWRMHVPMITAMQPENQSAASPDLPLHVPLVVDCGVLGGVITGITFGSFGLPIGYCGNFRASLLQHMYRSTLMRCFRNQRDVQRSKHDSRA